MSSSCENSEKTRDIATLGTTWVCVAAIRQKFPYICVNVRGYNCRSTSRISRLYDSDLVSVASQTTRTSSSSPVSSIPSGVLLLSQHFMSCFETFFKHTAIVLLAIARYVSFVTKLLCIGSLCFLFLFPKCPLRPYSIWLDAISESKSKQIFPVICCAGQPEANLF